MNEFNTGELINYESPEDIQNKKILQHQLEA